MSNAWPVQLHYKEITLRPLRIRDGRAWRRVRAENHEWLTPWEATTPYPSTNPAPTFRQSTRTMRREAKQGRAMPFVIEFRGKFVGQINVSDITKGALWSCHIGYWIDEAVSNRGIMTTAVALVTDHLMFTGKLHRVELAIRPENVPSNQLAQSLGFRFEGLRKSFLHINGDWCDHNIYVLLKEDLSEPLVNRLVVKKL